jgi:succinate dehydrogenase / fumarate reductase cytochrome b subunit
MLNDYLASSIGRKQIVAVTGLALILFLIGHLAGNLILFLGPEAFNAYAEKLAHLRPGLYVVEIGLLAIFLVHVYMTATLVLDNIKARGAGYRVKQTQGERSWAARLMPYTALAILAFVVWHLLDFTFVDKTGPRSMINGESLGLYGIVYNSFSDPFHSTLYIIAMVGVGLHLCHGVESCLQTFGLNNDASMKAVRSFSQWFAIAVSVGFSAIPVYVMIHYRMH